MGNLRIKRCPFCGGDNIGRSKWGSKWANTYCMTCRTCHAEGSMRKTEAEAEEAWNKRQEKDWRQEWKNLEDYIKTIEREEGELAQRAERPRDVIFEMGKVWTAMVILGYMSKHGEGDDDGKGTAKGQPICKAMAHPSGAHKDHGDGIQAKVSRDNQLHDNLLL